MSEDTTDLPVPGADRSSRPNPDATVLPFPSNHPPAEADRDAVQLRLRDVIGDVLRAERLRQERTLADVAREAAVSLPSLSEVERGRKEVSSDVLDAIGTALELPLVELLERSADRLRIDGATAPTSIGSGEFRMQSSTRFQLAA